MSDLSGPPCVCAIRIAADGVSLGKKGGGRRAEGGGVRAGKKGGGRSREEGRRAEGGGVRAGKKGGGRSREEGRRAEGGGVSAEESPLTSGAPKTPPRGSLFVGHRDAECGLEAGQSLGDLKPHIPAMASRRLSGAAAYASGSIV